MANRKINIAVDGYSSTGKSTMAKQLAEKLGYRYIDTGAMYRGVTLFALKNNLIEQGLVKGELLQKLDQINIEFQFNPTRKASDLYLNGERVEDEIRRQEVAAQVSKVAAVSEVRKFLVDQQRQMATKPGVVMDGRDIGTVVLPQAELKIFMTADTEIRAKRRYDELVNKGEQISLNEVRENLQQRDYIDTTREDSPLIQASDAILLDTTNLNVQQQLQIAINLVEEKQATYQ